MYMYLLTNKDLPDGKQIVILDINSKEFAHASYYTS